jgi:PGDYG protein
MLAEPRVVFRTSTRPGFQDAVSKNALAVRVRKREQQVLVRFAEQTCAVQTPEGVVHAHAGDAIVTGGAGEQWPIPTGRFERKYRPVAPTAAGAPGTYRSLALPVMALQMCEPFAVELGDRQSRLLGHAGDWLVDHGDGSLGIVAEGIFANTYEIAPTVRRIALHQRIQSALLAGLKLGPTPAPTRVPPPASLVPIIERVAPAHQAFNQRAIDFGDRYRSAFWSIYLLSSTAVLCAVLPLALGWDDKAHVMHPFAGAWALLEVVIIGAVGALYWRGHRKDWQGQWLAARTKAELAWYLPLLAPLVDLARADGPANWYARVFDEIPGLQSVDEIDALCARCTPLARQLLDHAWTDPEFVATYARWTADILEQQRLYHQRVARRQRALLERVHRINFWLFGLTALGALAHLLVHSLWLSLGTVFLPALGASLHGALAQTESYRLAASSERLALELQTAGANIAQALKEPDAARLREDVRNAITAAILLILDEHQDWHMLVRPHHLPLT